MVAVHDGGGGGTAIDYFDLHSPVGGTIQTQGRSIQTLSGDIENFSTDVQAGHNQAQQGVSGLIADAMVGAPQGVITNANNFNAMITSGGGAVIVYGHAIDTFNELVTSLNNQLREAPEAERAAKRAELAPQYTSGQDTLRAAARTARGQLRNPLDPSTVQALNAAGGLPTSVQNLFPSVSFTGHDPTELPPDLAELSDSELKEYLLAHPELAPTLLPLAPRNVRESIADDLVAQANDIRDSDPDDVPAEDLQKFAAMLAAYGTDEVVSTRFLNEVGPDGLLELNQSVALLALDIPDDQRIGDETPDSVLRGIQDVQLGLSGLLAAGSRNMSDERAADGKSVAPEWWRTLMDSAEKKFEYPDNRSMMGGQESYYGHQLLGPLMQNAEFDSNTRAVYESRLIQFEQDYADDNDGRLPWDDRSMHPSNEYVRLDWTHGWAQPGDSDNPEDYPLAGYDPVAGLMRQISDDPDHAQDFFTQYGSGDDRPTVEYLLHDREWSTDMVNGDRPMPGMDEGDPVTGLDHLGNAFRAATIEGTPDQDSVDIVESIVKSTHDRMPTGEDASRFSEDDFVNPALREDLSNVLGRYMPSVFTAMGNNPTEGVVLDDGSVFNDARFNDGSDDGYRSTQLMLAELAKDGAGREVLAGYTNAQTLDDLNTRLHGVTDVDDVERSVTATSNLSTRVLGAIDFGATSSAAEHTIEGDQSYNDSVDQGISAATGLLGETPVGKVPGAGVVMDLVGSAIGDSLHVDHRGELNQQVGTIFGNSQEQHAQIIRDAMWRNVPAGGYPEGMDGTEDLNNLSSSDQSAYDRWLADNDWGQEIDSRMSESRGGYDAGVGEAERSLEAYRN